MITKRGNDHRQRGIALIMTLVIVLLVSMFLSEFIFSTGLDLRGMSNVRNSIMARNLAKSAFRAVHVGLLGDEVDFMLGFAEVGKLIQLGGVPFEEGLLTELTIRPLDALFNVNELDNLRVDRDKDRARRILFVNTALDMRITATEFEEERAPTEESMLGIYAALFDWIDKDDLSYTGLSGYSGAEQDAYYNTEPEFEIKNGMLDRLEELRMVRGVSESEVPWEEWEKYFAAIPKRKSSYLLTERINVNLATREELVSFLRRREIDAEQNFVQKTVQDLQKGINLYAVHAEDIADELIPDEGTREVYTVNTLKSALSRVDEINPKLANFVLSTYNEYYGVHLAVEANGIAARVDALIHVSRGSNRIGKKLEILYVSLN